MGVSVNDWKSAASGSGIPAKLLNSWDMHAAKNEFEVVFNSIHMIRDCVETLKDLMKDCCVNLGEDGIRIATMDTARVALIDLSLRKGAFSHYRVEEKGCELGIDMHAFHKILTKCAKNEQFMMWKRVDEDVLRLRFFDPSKINVQGVLSLGDQDVVDLGDEFLILEKVLGSKPDQGRLAVDMSGEDSQKRVAGGEINVKYYEMPLLESDGIFPASASKEQPACEVRMGTKLLIDTVRKLSSFGNTVVVKPYDGGIDYNVSSELGHTKVVMKTHLDLSPDSSVDVNFLKGDKFCPGQSFAMKYLVALQKASDLTDSIHMDMYDGQPFHVYFDLVHRDNGRMEFFIAPKMEEAYDDQGHQDAW